MSRSLEVKQCIPGRGESISKGLEECKGVSHLANRAKLVHCGKNIGHSCGVGVEAKEATVTGVSASGLVTARICCETADRRY